MPIGSIVMHEVEECLKDGLKRLWYEKTSEMNLTKSVFEFFMVNLIKIFLNDIKVALKLNNILRISFVIKMATSRLEIKIVLITT